MTNRTSLVRWLMLGLGGAVLLSLGVLFGTGVFGTVDEANATASGHDQPIPCFDNGVLGDDVHPFDDPTTPGVDGPHICIRTAGTDGPLGLGNAGDNVDFDEKTVNAVTGEIEKVEDTLLRVMSGPIEYYQFEAFIPAGEQASAHYHPGPLYVTVVEGKVYHIDTFVNDDGEIVRRKTKFGPGESFFEAPFVSTIVEALPGKDVRLAVFTIVEEGGSPIIPAPLAGEQ